MARLCKVSRRRAAFAIGFTDTPWYTQQLASR